MLIRFQQEARATALLKHSNIVEVLDFGLGSGGSAYMVLEFVEASNLGDWLQTKGPFSDEETMTMLAGVCRALDFAHNKGVYHRDLKPQNILVGNNREPKLIDFGLALMLSPEQNNHETQGLSLAGSPSYMSPDQFLGRPYDARSEIYSLGCVIFACLTGTPPFHAETPLELASQHAEAKIPTLQQFDQSRRFSERLERAIRRCLEKDPELRYSSISELANDLQIEMITPTQRTSEGSIEQASTSRSQRLANDSKSQTDLNTTSRPENETSGGVTADDTTKDFTGWVIVGVMAIVLLFGGIAVYSLQPPPSEERSLKQVNKRTSTLSLFNVTLDMWMVRREVATAQPGASDEDFKLLANDKRSQQLRKVIVEQSKVSGTGIQYLKGMPITTIKIMSENFSDEALDYISSLPKLKELHLGETDKLTLNGYKKIANSQITDVKLQNMKVPDGSLLELSKSSNLRSLWLRNITPEKLHTDYKPIASMRSLGFLEITHYDFSNDDLKLLSDLKEMREIAFINLDLNDDNLEILQTLPGLREVNFSGTMITKKGLEKIGKIKRLRSVVVAGCPNLAKKDVIAFREKHPQVSITTAEEENLLATTS